MSESRRHPVILSVSHSPALVHVGQVITIRVKAQDMEFFLDEPAYTSSQNNEIVYAGDEGDE